MASSRRSSQWPPPYPALIRNAPAYDLGFLNAWFERPAEGGAIPLGLIRATEKEPF